MTTPTFIAVLSAVGAIAVAYIEWKKERKALSFVAYLVLVVALAVIALQMVSAHEEAETDKKVVDNTTETLVKQDELAAGQTRAQDSLDSIEKTVVPKDAPDDAKLLAKYPLGYIIFGSDEGDYSIHMPSGQFSFDKPKVNLRADWESTVVRYDKFNDSEFIFPITYIGVRTAKGKSYGLPVSNGQINLFVPMRVGEIRELKMPSGYFKAFVEIINDKPERIVFVLGFVEDKDVTIQ